MFDSMLLPVLLAQEQSSSLVDTLLRFAYVAGIFALVFVLPFVLGNLVARATRMPGYEFKIGLILCSLAVSLFIVVRAWDFEAQRLRLPMGVDLKGGVILVYEVDTESTARGRSPADAGDINMGDLVQALTNRINPSGTKEIVIRPYGEQQVEIIIPEVETEEVEVIKQLVRTAGSLEFRIVANSRDHGHIIDAAEEQSQSPIADVRFRRRVMEGDEVAGFWAQAAREKLKAAELDRTILRNPATGEIVTLAEIGPIESGQQGLDKYLEAHGLENLDVLLAMDDDCNVTGDYLGVVAAGSDEYLNPCVNFRLLGEGARLFSLLTSANRPNMNESPPFYRHLGIMLDERLISFPRLITTISDSGRITGDFTTPEVEFLVGILRAGRLPATLRPEPISENHIGSMLGDDTIRKGKVSIVVSLVAVLLCVAVYYRFCGIVACAALLMNLLLVVAVMVLLNAPLTLPGLAGLVLTIGMSVDANVLVFERFREEMARGAAVRMAIRNGFTRATTTIVDSNLTTLITGLVLYAIGTDQIRGFAVTLILGIVMSMYTAVFCAHVVFDMAERNGWIKDLKMMKFVGQTQLDFLGVRRIAVGGSLLLILVSLVMVGVRGKRILDIDFNGGLSVTMVLRESLTPDEVRARLSEHFRDSSPPVQCSVNTVDVEGRPDNSVYKIDADIPEQDVDVLEDAIKQTFRDASGNTLLQTYTMDFEGLKQARAPDAEAPGAAVRAKEGAEQGSAAKEQPVPRPPAEETPAPESKASEPSRPPAVTGEPNVPATTEKVEQQATKPASDPAPAETTDPPQKRDGEGASHRRRDLPGDHVLAWAGSAGTAALEESESGAEPAASPSDQPPNTAEAPAAKPALDGETGSAAAAAQPAPVTLRDKPGTEATAAEEIALRTVGQLSFREPINAPTLREIIRQAYNRVFEGQQPGAKATRNAAGELEVPGLLVSVDERFNWNQESSATSPKWFISMISPQEDAQRVLVQMRADLAETPVFPSSSKIGGKVAGDTRTLAVAALVASMIGIVAYIWVRFQHVIFGLAAVVALVHDVLLTLGAIAISAYLAKPLGFLLIDEFRISLPIVAALLTIIGYSLNDTIVVFDRIREVRGKSPNVTAEMINLSINQTLSRTLLTGVTTMIVLLILYAIGGQGIHGFAFAMIVGIVLGTYSSIFIASPLLLWMIKPAKALR